MRKGVFWGIVLMLAGVLMILRQQGLITVSWGILWPVVVAGLGVYFHFLYFAEGRKSPGVLVPGGILLTYGALFITMYLTSWTMIEVFWPVFILGPALGIAELTLATRGKEGSWTAVLILAVIGGFFLMQNMVQMSLAILFGALLIVLGVGIMVKAFIRKKAHTDTAA